MGRWLLRALFVVLGAGTGLVLAELGTHLLAPRGPVFELRGLHEFRPDQPWLYGLRPGAEGHLSSTGAAVYRINEDGFRGPRYALPKPPGVVRVVVMGDSIAFGYGVEEEAAFPRAIEKLLARRAPEPRVEVVNLSVGGYNAWNEARLLEGVGVTYEPDLVLVQFCTNDLNDPSMHFNAQTRLVLSAIPDDAFPDPSQRRGESYARSRALAWCARSRLCAVARDVWLASDDDAFDAETRRAAVVPVEGDEGPEWDWLETRYLEMAAAAEAVGARFAVLAFPYRNQLRGRGPDPVQERLVALGRRHGWPVVDPLPAFRKARTRRLFRDRWHPTAEGHRIAAEATLEGLACAGLLPEQARGLCPGDADAGARAH